MYMHPLLFVDGLMRRGRRLADRLWIPLWNRHLRQRAKQETGLFHRALDESISRGLRYFELLPGLEMTTVIALWPAFQTGLEPRLRFLTPALQYHRARFNNSDLRLIDEDYDPAAPEVASLLHIPPNHPINELMEKCLYADRLGLDAGILDELARLEDRGFYGTTHIVWGCLLLRRFSNISGSRIEALLDRGVESMIRRQKVDGVGDLFAERIAFLQWADRHGDVDPAWLWRLALAQRPDGGWRRLWSIWPQQSSQHASCLALAALIQFRARTMAGAFGGNRRA